jgi:hypothetical protein
MNEREFDLLTAAPEVKGGGDKTPLTESRECSADKARWLRAINRAGAFVRGLYVGAAANPFQALCIQPAANAAH